MTKKKKSARLLAGFALLGTALVAGCQDNTPIKVGFVGSLTGRTSEVSQASWNAVQLAVAEVNENGGIKGRPVEIIVRDNEGSPDIGGENVQALVDEGVVAIIGPNLSSVAKGMMPVIEKNEVVTVSPTVSSMAFVGKDDLFFRMNSTTGQNTAAYAKYQFDNGDRRVAIFYDLGNRVFAESWVNEFTKSFSALGGEVISTQGFQSKEAVQFSEVVPPILEMNPDAVIIVGHGVDAALIAQQVRKSGSNVKLLTSRSASTQLIELGGKSVEGVTLLQSFDRYSEDPGYVKFRKAYEDRFKTSPAYSSLAAYDAAAVLFAALEIAEQGQELKETLLSQDAVQGLQQDLVFDQFGDGSRRQFFVTVQDGKFVAN